MFKYPRTVTWDLPFHRNYDLRYLRKITVGCWKKRRHTTPSVLLLHLLVAQHHPAARDCLICLKRRPKGIKRVPRFDTSYSILSFIAYRNPGKTTAFATHGLFLCSLWFLLWLDFCFSRSSWPFQLCKISIHVPARFRTYRDTITNKNKDNINESQKTW